MATATVCAPCGDMCVSRADDQVYRDRAHPSLASWSLRFAPPTLVPVSLPPASKRRRVGPPPHFRLFDELPVEIVEHVLAYLDLEDLGRLRSVNRAFHALLRDPRHYADIAVPHLPLLHPGLLAFLPSVLSGTRHLSLRAFPSSSLSTILPACSARLTTLDLSFSAVRDYDLLALARVAEEGGFACQREVSALQNLRVLRLKGCRRLSTFLAQLCASPPALHALETLDVSWSSLSLLPLPLSAHFPALKELNLSTTPYLPLPHLASALASLPALLSTLDLSHLGLAARDLRDLGAPPPELCGVPARGLRLVLVGNDALTLQSLAALQRHWAAPSSRWAGRAPVEVEHSPVLLESDEEEDVRRFVQMVAGVVMRGGSEQERASVGMSG